MNLRRLLLALFLAAFAAGAAPAHAETNVLFIFDSSGSMKKKIDTGEQRMTVAKRAMAQALEDMPADVRVGLLLYGHRKAKDCTDIELKSPIGADDAATIARTIGDLKPKGETPIAAALEQAIRSFAALKGQSNRVVLVTGRIRSRQYDVGHEQLMAAGAAEARHVQEAVAGREPVCAALEDRAARDPPLSPFGGNDEGVEHGAALAAVDPPIVVHVGREWSRLAPRRRNALAVRAVPVAHRLRLGQPGIGP